MKVIDLLNKIANGEEVPRTIKFHNQYYQVTDCAYGDYKDYISTLTDNYLFDDEWNLTGNLNEEVEVIEDKKIEKLDIRNEKNCKNNWKWKVYGEEHSYNISTPQKIIADKINEIIDYLEENK